ncbi:MAG: ABC-type sugar transport system, ATPase component [Haloquadratum sp. J07HQX50]|nr:MAG: ABC-type sugar transport system, ATPase component [Haloquadratum sp. J07HQX50]
MARLELDDVTKVYDTRNETIVAVEELDLDIRDGEFIVVVGPSGCGKSTTLRMIAGLETVTNGEIRLGNERINERAPKDRDIAMVFQSYALYPHKTVRDNIAYGLQLSTDLTGEEIDKRVENAADMMGITDLLQKKPSALSGGQQQRVATGRAIVREPELFLFDEPLSNLDAKLRKHMRTELSRIHSEFRTTTVYVTHDQEEAMTMADRIVILRSGELQQVGAPKEVYHRPANRFVADFIGSPSMNFRNVELNRSGGQPRLSGDGFEYDLDDRVLSQVNRSTSKLEMGVRPEDVTIDPNAPTEKSFEATVDVVEIVGSDNFVYLSLSDKEFRVRVDSSIEPSEGEVVRMTFDDDDIHLFDTTSGEAYAHGLPRTDRTVTADKGDTIAD